MNISTEIQAQSLQGRNYFKAAMLLTVAIFLISAPSPDPSAIADMASHLIAIAKNPALG